MPHHKPHTKYSERYIRRRNAIERDRLFEIEYRVDTSENESEEEIPTISEEESPILSEEEKDISSDSDVKSDNDPMEGPYLLSHESSDSAGTVPRSKQSRDAMFII